MIDRLQRLRVVFPRRQGPSSARIRNTDMIFAMWLMFAGGLLAGSGIAIFILKMWGLL